LITITERLGSDAELPGCGRKPQGETAANYGILKLTEEINSILLVSIDIDYASLFFT
jgi:hypothetical protein